MAVSESEGRISLGWDNMTTPSDPFSSATLLSCYHSLSPTQMVNMLTAASGKCKKVKVLGHELAADNVIPGFLKDFIGYSRGMSNPEAKIDYE